MGVLIGYLIYLNFKQKKKAKDVEAARVKKEKAEKAARLKKERQAERNKRFKEYQKFVPIDHDEDKKGCFVCRKAECKICKSFHSYIVYLLFLAHSAFFEDGLSYDSDDDTTEDTASKK